MIQENKKARIHLFWGGKTKKSLELYNKYIISALENKTLTSFYIAYSQDQQRPSGRSEARSPRCEDTRRGPPAGRRCSAPGRDRRGSAGRRGYADR